ncbi:unnamed protein product [Polarella glacialis]|uniref:WSC domain-containing protein n=1 Tax=Polarella glacialis TaxID=89957 RepID=A0A813K2Q9_POLGL|nr:unnamed protein product [Polarella glacialis]
MVCKIATTSVRRYPLAQQVYEMEGRWLLDTESKSALRDSWGSFMGLAAGFCLGTGRQRLACFIGLAIGFVVIPGSHAYVEVYNCTASSSFAPCSNAFDGNLTSAWMSTGPATAAAPQWLELRTAGGQEVRLGSYSLRAASRTAGGGASAPTSWKLEGISPQTLTLDTGTAQTWQDGQNVIREISSPKAFSRFRFTASSSSSAVVALAELQLMTLVIYRFVAADWGVCSVSCGGGTQQRQVTCMGSDGVSYSDGRCAIGTPPERTRECGQASCACQGDLVCTSACSSSSRQHVQLGCHSVMDGLQVTSWTSAEAAPQWLEFDLGAVKEAVAFSLTVGTCAACSASEAPGIISLIGSNDAQASGSSSGRGVTVLSQQSTGPRWSSGETRRWKITGSGGNGGGKFRYWRVIFHSVSGAATDPASIAEVGLYAPGVSFSLNIGDWSACIPQAGSGSCGVGVNQRSVTCSTGDGQLTRVELCQDGPQTAMTKYCVVPCPTLYLDDALAHPSLFAILRVELTTSSEALVTCAAFEFQPGASRPGSVDVLALAAHKKVQLCPTTNCTVEISGLMVTSAKGTVFEVWCMINGGSAVFGPGRRAVLLPTPQLLGCYGDQPAGTDLPESRGSDQSQLSCADKCYGFQYFGLQSTGDCFCGNSYGKYGPATKDLSQGLLGCDCNGPFYGYFAQCVWEQTAGRWGDVTVLRLSPVAANTNSAEILAAVSPNTSLQCNVSVASSSYNGSASSPTTSSTCSDTGGCTLRLGALTPDTTYEVSCKADPDSDHPYKRSAALLVRTLAAARLEVVAETTSVPQSLQQPAAARASLTMSPLPWDDHGTPPWEWLPIVSSGLAVLAIAATRACTGQRCRGSFEALDLPHTIWLVWELLVIADPVLGALLLQELLYSRFTGPEPHWDTLSMLMAGSLMCAGAMHVIAFLLYGVLPSLGRQAAGGLLSKVNFSRHLVGHHRYSSAASVVSKRGRNSSKKLSGNGLAAALPPDLDPTEGASAFHFLPLAAIVAVCAASHNDISAVAAAKVGMRVVLLLIGNTVQVACSVLYVTSSWPVAASPGVSVGCWLNTMMIIAGMILVKTRGGFAAGDDTLPLVQASIASSFDLPISAAAPPLVQQAFQAPPQPKTASKGRRPKNDVKKNFDASAESSSAAAESHLRALGRPQVRQTEDPSWRVAPRRGEPPPQLPRRGEAAPQPALVGAR